MDRATLKELLRLAYPMIISQGAFAVMIFTDRYFMSLVSPTHMGASLAGGVASFFCMSLFIGVLSYGNALTAQYFGRKQFDKCSRVVTQGLLLTLFFAPLLVAIGYLSLGSFEFMGHAPEQVVLARQYFIILIWGASFSLAKTCIASYFSGIGRTHIVMIADTVGVAINIPLTWVLIFGYGEVPALGIAGAAYATIISSLISLLIFCYFYLEPHHATSFMVKQSFQLDRGILRRFVRLGFPSGIEMFLNVAAFNLFLLMFQSYGIAESASAAIVFNWDIVSFVPMIGLNVAIISLIGRYIGAGDTTLMSQVIRISFMLGLGYSSILALLFYLGREPLVAIFLATGSSGEIQTLASFMMIGLATYVMADATILVAGGVLRGAGDTRWLMWASVLIHWLMLAVQYFVIKVWELGPKVSWVVFVSMILMTAIMYLLRLTSSRWRTPEAFARVMSEQ
ncbi:MAG: MATE family efflux transporter [Gammaproteobacteria bacterium]|jgi:MATE family multidrug resistance protein|nr:MATE family efflux transporter [Gammaproteobacteria bacterium]MBT5199538.1 MATE family efflux transporter [Gammaproteobacteria bacterium]MBT5791933.1 MATE family efflux transporter [Gammaproteobacteria bacterium]MBT6668304.1 MATE family efflux transporter [Gammaproteobacteria bacterium]MBT7532909.1 MATE family efflux transporter [Gammaproteobacteria bacterium]|tara:strand:- start:3 stop:1361 length:1359 start_codon:yes stop_codon:yes gene_type:complete